MSAHLRWIVFSAAFAAQATLHAVEPVKLQRLKVPAPPWPAGDERGMANQIGPATLVRCAWHMQQPGSRTYEISHLRSNTMPLSPFTGPYVDEAEADVGHPGTAHAFNSEALNEGAEPAQQGTQIDALGHFAALKQPWDGSSPLAVDEAAYYGGFTQKDVKPTPDSPIAQARHGQGAADRHHRGAARREGACRQRPADEGRRAGHRRAHPGDAEGAGHREPRHPARATWSMCTPAGATTGATRTPRRSITARRRAFRTTRRATSASDASWSSAWTRRSSTRCPTGLLAGKAGPAPGTPAGLPFAVHHHMLTQMGIHHIENAKLDELARDKVWTSCTMILPARQKGAAGAEVRPVAIGTREARTRERSNRRSRYFFCQDARRKRLRRVVIALRVPAYSCTFSRIGCRMSSGSAAAASSKREITSSALRPVVEKAACLVPYECALGGVRTVTELEQSHFAARLPDEQVEELVVEPAPLRRWVVGNTQDFFQHGGVKPVDRGQA